MPSLFIALFIFLFIFFSYIHVTSCWKTSDDLELYESEYVSSTQLQEIVAVKQPTVFNLFPIEQISSSVNTNKKREERVFQFCEKFQVAKMEKYDNIDVRVKNVNDYFTKPGSGSESESESESVEWANLTLRSAQTLLSTDTNGKYMSETNDDFMEETNLNGFAASHLDPILRPPLAVFAKYDFIFGSPLATTPLRYHMNYQQFIVVCSGKIRVKMIPPKYRKVLDIIEDYNYYEFWSPLRIWSDPSALNKRDKEIRDRIKFVEFEVLSGQVLFIPPYWFCSWRFSGDKNTTICSISYDTLASIAANAKPLAIHLMQKTQTTTVVTQTRHYEEELSSEEIASNATANDVKVTPGFRSGFEMEHVDEINEQNKKPEVPGPITDKKMPLEIVTNAGIYKIG